ncbi:MAG TPA: hypothetical protein VLS89_08460, partial [Candidatus Nanopelagicales bacterium]|nr:hypothetical protein [Candidatus Nanopelagicales bacterium]
DVAWGRVVPRSTAAAPTRAAPITLALRRDLPWLLGAGAASEAATAPVSGSASAPVSGSAPGSAPFSDSARAVLSVLDQSGASFMADLAAATALPMADIEAALWELVAAGALTADGFAALRALMEPSPRGGGVAGRLARGAPVASGRWALLRPPAAPDIDILEALARQYLCRYGLVFRDLLAREPAAPPWSALLRVYRRMEMTGELRGGRLVAGFVGEQFALPEALDALRALRREPPSGELLEISACDPLNLVGIVTPGPRIPAVMGNVVIYRDGVPLVPIVDAEREPRDRAPLDPVLQA